MRRFAMFQIIGLLGAAGVAGCRIQVQPNYPPPPPPPPPPQQIVVEREYVDGSGPPDAYVEVIPARPYYGAVWERGHWVRYRHRWVWVYGRWR